MMADKIYVHQNGQLVAVDEIQSPSEVPVRYGQDSPGKDLPRWFTVCMMIAVVLLLLGAMVLLFSVVKWTSAGYAEFNRRETIIQACLDSEQYTRAECIIIGGSK